MLRDVAKGSIAAGIGIGLLAIIEYVYVVYTGNRLPPPEFGRLNTAVAILTIVLSISSAGIGATFSRFVAQAKGAEEVSAYVTSSSILQFIVGGGASIVIFLIAGMARGARVDDIRSLLWILGAILPIAALATTLPYGMLGLKRMIDFNTGLVLNVGVRLIAVVLLLSSSAKAEEALASFLVGGIAGVLFCVVGLRDYYSFGSARIGIMREILQYSLPAALSSMLVVLFMRVDVLLLKGLVEGNPNLIIAQYTAPATLARGLFLLTSAVSLALLPAVARTRGLPVRNVLKVLGSVSVGCVLVVVLSMVFGERLLSLLFPTELEELSYLLPFIVTGVALLSLAHMLATALIAGGRPGASAFAFVCGFGVYIGGSAVLVSMDGMSWWGAASAGKGAAESITASLIIGASVALIVELLALRKFRSEGIGAVDVAGALPPIVDSSP